jgi:hypothetical protein
MLIANDERLELAEINRRSPGDGEDPAIRLSRLSRTGVRTRNARLRALHGMGKAVKFSPLLMVASLATKV